MQQITREQVDPGVLFSPGPVAGFRGGVGRLDRDVNARCSPTRPRASASSIAWPFTWRPAISSASAPIAACCRNRPASATSNSPNSARTSRHSRARSRARPTRMPRAPSRSSAGSRARGATPTRRRTLPTTPHQLRASCCAGPKATASTSPARWWCWRARSACRRASSTASRRATRTRSAVSSRWRSRTRTPGSKSTSKKAAGCASTRRRPTSAWREATPCARGTPGPTSPAPSSSGGSPTWSISTAATRRARCGASGSRGSAGAASAARPRPHARRAESPAGRCRNRTPRSSASAC